MLEPFSDRQLEAVLASVGRHLVVPTGAVPVRALPERRQVRPSTRLALLAAAAVAVVLLATGAAVAPVREAVADWLGIGSTSIEQVPRSEADPRGLPSLSADAVPVTPAGARAELGRPLPVVRDRQLGKPLQLAVPSEGGVLMAWPRGQTTLWVHGDDGSAAVFVKKLLSGGDGVTSIRGLGDGAALIEGEHVLETPARRVAAGRVLLWVDEGLEHRLESELPRARMLEIARSVSASGR